MPKFVVVRVNGDDSDTHAAEITKGSPLPTARRHAVELANPDTGDRVEWAIVKAEDSGAARLIEVGAGLNWRTLTRGEVDGPIHY